MAWAHDPTATPSPLPDLRKRRKRSSGGFEEYFGWPVGLLPAGHLAADLAARGVTYRRGIGYALSGERFDASQVARLLADILSDAAEVLPDPFLAISRGRSTASLHQKIDAQILAMEASRANLLRDGLVAPEWSSLLSRRGYPSGTGALFISVATAGQIAEDTPETLDDRREIRRALRSTADDLRTSRAAQANALALVAPLVPDGVAIADTAAARAFLARWDGERVVRRSALWSAYEAEGCPGGLSRSALATLAADRWGRAVKSSGHFAYRPGGPSVGLRLH